MGRDSIVGTLLVALVLCVVCSVLVSGTAYVLHSRQESNKLLYEKQNILKAAGLIRPKDSEADEYDPAALVEGKSKPTELEELFGKRVRKVLVNLDDGTIVPEDQIRYNEYDPREAANDPAKSEPIGSDVKPTPGVDRRPKMQFVYEIMAEGDSDKILKYVLPINGKGLWSTLYGFIAIDADGKTIRGITFYEHGETPGLGGEVENANWQEQWDGKLAYNEDHQVIIQVVKGSATPDDRAWTVDGLSGATITTRGVSNFVQYWLGPDGFGPFLMKQTGISPSETATTLRTTPERPSLANF